MHFLDNGVRSSPFGAALTAACVANCVAAAACAADALLTGNLAVLARFVSVFPTDSNRLSEGSRFTVSPGPSFAH